MKQEVVAIIMQRKVTVFIYQKKTENIKASIITNVMKVLPDIIKEVIQLIVEKSQILINANLEKEIFLLLFPV